VVSSITNHRNFSTRTVPLELFLRRSTPTRWRSQSASPLRWDVGTVIAKSLLDHVHAGLLSGEGAAAGAISELFSGLYSLRSSATPDAWRALADQCVNHPVIEFIHQDPFTQRSFKKPRGYAGDAVLIDYIYSGRHDLEGPDQVSELGKMIFRFTTGAPASAGVRCRRDLMAAIIDETCGTVEKPKMLSVACGHLREATLSRGVPDHQAGRFVALDQDELSLDVVKQSSAEHGVIPVCSSIKALFRGELAEQRFDLIYSTGLYDYLEDRIAGKLAARMFQMLNPGGRLVVANFLPDIWCAGFMETFMGWTLIYRNSEQMLQLTNGLPEEDVYSKRTFNEKNANIVLLDVKRR
jgi:extracellular factor (EF) 3-hydroxypalmitic acid methyl ester biosynthesis protein